MNLGPRELILGILNRGKDCKYTAENMASFLGCCPREAHAELETLIKKERVRRLYENEEHLYQSTKFQ